MIKVGQVVYNRDKSEVGVTTGSGRRCQSSGCSGFWIMVRWDDGKVTWPCLKPRTST